MNKSSLTSSWVPGFIALGITWGASFLFIKWGLLSLNPVGVAFFRCFIGALALWIFALATKVKLPHAPKDLLNITIFAFLLNAFPALLFAYGETHVSSVMAGLLNATTPLMTVLVISIAFREQQIDRNQAVGIFIGFVGIALVTGALSGVAGNDLKGVGALLLATLCYGIAMPYSRRFISPMPYPATALATVQVSSAALLLLPLALIHGTNTHAWSGKSFLGMILLGALGTGLAYIWNFRNVKLAGSVVASSVTYLTPIVAAALGTWLLHEKFGLNQAVGGLLVLISAALVQKRLRIFPARS
jgi:drug/metabolite transporter (DMT)-like permease